MVPPLLPGDCGAWSFHTGPVDRLIAVEGAPDKRGCSEPSTCPAPLTQNVFNDLAGGTRPTESQLLSAERTRSQRLSSAPFRQ